jgi:hypothetical protein
MGYAGPGPGRCGQGSWWKPTLASPTSDAARSLRGAGRARTRSGQVCSPCLVDLASKVGLGLTNFLGYITRGGFELVPSRLPRRCYYRPGSELDGVKHRAVVTFER